MQATTIVLWGAGIVALWVVVKRHQRRADAQREFQYALRYPETYSWLEETHSGRAFLDFPQMLFVFKSSDYDYCHVRVFHLRRQDGPVWHVREEAASRQRSWAHFKVKRETALLFPEDLAEEEAALRDEEAWTPAATETIEPLYQLYLHRLDPTVSFVSPVETEVARDFLRGARRPSTRVRRPEGP